MEKKLNFLPHLYLGDGMKPQKVDKLKKRLVNKPLPVRAYLITISLNPADQLELFDARQLAQSWYDHTELTVVGLAKNYDDALRVVERITQDCLGARGDCELKEFLLC